MTALVDLTTDPRVMAAQAVADTVLAPEAEKVDQDGVPARHLRALAAAGLFGLAAPPEDGGSAAPPAVMRWIVEILAGADCATWFVWAQHHAPLGMLTRAETPVRARLASSLASGDLVSGVAFSHLRRHPDRPVAATRVAGGWSFDGVAPWYTGWGLNNVFLLGGATDDGRVIFGFTEAIETSALRPSKPMELAALSGTSTVRLHLSGLVVPDDDVVAVIPFTDWATGDRRTTVNVNPAVLGVTAAAVRLIGERAVTSGEPAVADVGERLAATLSSIRRRCYHLIDDVDPDDALEERLAARADAQHLMIEATTALVAAGAGASMALSSPAQRLARQAMFLLVQAQTVQGRTATLTRWGR